MRSVRDAALARPRIKKHMERSLRGGAPNPSQKRDTIVTEPLPVCETAVDYNADRHSGRQRGRKGCAIEQLRAAAPHVVKVVIPARSAVGRGLSASKAAGNPILVLARRDYARRRGDRKVRRGRRSGLKGLRVGNRRRGRGCCQAVTRQKLGASRQFRPSHVGGWRGFGGPSGGSNDRDESADEQRTHQHPRKFRSRHAACSGRQQKLRVSSGNACGSEACHHVVSILSRRLRSARRGSFIGRSSIQNCARKGTFAGDPTPHFAGVRKI
jgi:hypothetical protein